ncbi:hypothetical protein ACA910_012301 [Epithemia clementina (nom. ined.)]
METDPPLLWQALGGTVQAVNDRLQWFGLPAFQSFRDFQALLQSIEQNERPALPTNDANTGSSSSSSSSSSSPRPLAFCVNVFRIPIPSSSLSSSSAATNDQNADTINQENELAQQQQYQVAGMASYMATQINHGTTEIGYVAHGQAMAQTPAATEAHYLLLRQVLEPPYLYRRVEWKCHAQNIPSNQAAVRLGYTYEGCFRQHRVTANKTNRDTHWYSLLDREWPLRKAALEAWLDPRNFNTTSTTTAQPLEQRQRLQDFHQQQILQASNNTGASKPSHDDDEKKNQTTHAANVV